MNRMSFVELERGGGGEKERRYIEERSQGGVTTPNPFPGQLRRRMRRRDRAPVVEERASASQIESPHPGTHYFLLPLVQIFVRGARVIFGVSAGRVVRYREDE